MIDLDPVHKALKLRWEGQLLWVSPLVVALEGESPGRALDLSLAVLRAYCQSTNNPRECMDAVCTSLSRIEACQNSEEMIAVADEIWEQGPSVQFKSASHYAAARALFSDNDRRYPFYASASIAVLQESGWFDEGGVDCTIKCFNELRGQSENDAL
ncbi:MAG: hypothetical protein MUF06_23790 [Pirellulaceae bacterium]|jgi:hypothetical protein|nr:hypothetical protein [Pirellulaceae bacterium]